MPERLPELRGVLRPGPGSALPALAVWLPLILTALFATGLLPLFSTRTLAVAWEMWSQGQFLVPLHNGAPYSHKTPLMFWLIHVGWLVGGVNDIWPRLLQALLGGCWIWLAARLARQLFAHPRIGGWTAWLLVAFSYVFLFSLQVMYELLLAAVVLLALSALAGRRSTRQPSFVLFAAAVAAGLFAKGPVMLLHVVFPVLAGSLWQPWARQQPRRWYGGAVLALLVASLLFAAWFVAAGMLGGASYREELWFMQTAGRVVNSFDHAQPAWWYLLYLPLLLLPWLLWPRLWRAAVASLHQRGDGLCFLACWLLPVLLAFSLISGKQLYYLLPEMAGVAILLASGLASLANAPPVPAWRDRPWPLALAMLLIAALLAGLPCLVGNGHVRMFGLVQLADASPWFAVALGALGGLVLAAPRVDARALPWLASAGLLAVVLLYGAYAVTLWPRFDLRPAAQQIAVLQQAGVPVAHLGNYHAQYHFLGRLREPLAVVLTEEQLTHWRRDNPHGWLVHYQREPSAAELRRAAFNQPFRSRWLLLEPAAQRSQPQAAPP